MCAVLPNSDFLAKSSDVLAKSSDFSNRLGDFFSCQKRLATFSGGVGDCSAVVDNDHRSAVSYCRQLAAGAAVSPAPVPEHSRAAKLPAAARGSPGRSRRTAHARTLASRDDCKCKHFFAVVLK